MHNEYKDVGPTSRQAVQELDPVYDKNNTIKIYYNTYKIRKILHITIQEKENGSDHDKREKRDGWMTKRKIMTKWQKKIKKKKEKKSKKNHFFLFIVKEDFFTVMRMVKKRKYVWVL